MLKVVLTSFLFIMLAELVPHTVWLLDQLVFCTYALFGTLKFTMNVVEWLRHWTPDQTFVSSNPSPIRRS